MSLPVYETILNILREAGFVLQVRNESADLNGAVITTAFPNIISANSDTAVATTSDVQVTINGEIATISAIDAGKGKITLSEVPTEGATVLVDYYYSPATLDFVEVVREDAECAISSKMKKVDPCAPYSENVPYCVRLMTRLWAAGLLLAREYGYNTDTENSSKDGYRKIEEAKAMLEEFYSEGGACGSNGSGQIDTKGGSGDMIASSKGDLFSCHRHLDCQDSDFCFDKNLGC